MEKAEIPAEWLKKLAEKYLTEEEKKQIEAMGWDKLMETLKQAPRRNRRGRHQGGSKWIGTAGTSPFGAYGYNPEGVRIGQDNNRNLRAVKVWDKREFKDLDGKIELGIRNIKVALRRLRKFARTGAPDELDLDRTIKRDRAPGLSRRSHAAGAAQRGEGAGVLRHRRLDGLAHPQVEELFSAAKSEFKHMEYFYFHNCLYEGVWKQNRRRFTDRTPTWDVLHKYPHDYKIVFVGDASMSPYEIMVPGGSVEHVNEEPGSVWLDRVTRTYPHAIWLNPVPQKHWDYSESTTMMRRLFANRMFPLTHRGSRRRDEGIGPLTAPPFVLRSTRITRGVMPQTITRGIKPMLDEANAQIETMTPQQVSAAMADGDVVLVDIRDPREIERDGRIPGAFSCTRGMLEFWIDPQSPYAKPVFQQDKKFIFHCAGGLRSALAAKTADDMGLSPVAHMEGGFGAWQKAGLPTETTKR